MGEVITEFGLHSCQLPKASLGKSGGHFLSLYWILCANIMFGFEYKM